MNLTKHFTLAELTVSQEAARRGISNEPDAEALENLKTLALTLEAVRELLGHPVLISSGYRSPKVNSAVGGSRTSAHMQGLAADFICPGFGSPREIVNAISNSQIRFDQLINEFGSWVHIGVSPTMRGQVLIASRRDGKVHYERMT